MMKNPSRPVVTSQLLCSLLISTPLMLAVGGPNLHFEVTTPATSNEFTRSVQLSWDASPGITYHVQTTTNLGDAASWNTIDLVEASSTTARWMAPEAIHDSRYYRLLAHPTISSLEPSFIDSTDPNAALYILGELLPTNATVMLNGRVFIPTIIQSNGVWAAVRLNGLPPGEPVIGTLTVVDAGTGNVVATLSIQSPLFYGTGLTTEQLQGPPEQPPAAPNYTRATKSRSNVQNNRTAAGGDDLDRDLWPDAARSYVVRATKSRSNVQNNRMAGGDDPRDDDCNGFTAFFKSASGLSMTTDATDYQEGGVSGGSRRAPAAEPRVSAVLSSGELRVGETDLAIPGRGFDFVWTRTYRSRTGPNTTLGHGWDFSYNLSLNLQSDGTVQFCSGNGRCDTFYPDGKNGWVRDEWFVTIADLDKDGLPDLVTFADGAQATFSLLPGPAQGKPVTLKDRNGNTMTFVYDGLGRLLSIVDTLGRTNSLQYNASGLLQSLTDFSGRTVGYQYDSNGDLIACVSPPVVGTPNGNDFPGGKTNHYAYSTGFADERLNHNLISCTDAKGQVSLQIVYQTNQDPASVDFDAVAYTQRGTDRKDIWRGRLVPSPTNAFAATQVIVRDAVGNVTEYFYDSRQRCVRELDYTGRANPSAPTTPLLNRPKNKLRAGDPDFFETLWQWNNDSLCTLITSGGIGNGAGRINRIRMIYSREIDSTVSPRKKGDMLVLREYACCAGADMDGDGVGDITERTWHFEYDPTRGSTPLGAAYHAINTKGAGSNAGKYVTPCTSRYTPPTGGFLSSQDGIPATQSRVRPHGWDGTIKGNMRVRLNELETRLNSLGLLGRFASGPRQSTDLSGNYGGKGIHPTAPEICDPSDTDEDCDGFVTSVTDPRGLLTTCTYDTHGNRTSWKHHDIQGLDAPTLEFTYDPFGQLTAVTNSPDANGYRRVDTFDYYTNGPQKGYVAHWIIDAQGPTLIAWNFEYDSRGNLTRLVDPRGNDRKFHNNALNQRVRVESATNKVERCITDYFYDANDNLEQAIVDLRDENDTKQYGHAILIGHDYADRIVSLAEQTSINHFVTNRFEYDPNDNVSAIYSPLAVTGAEPNNLVTFQYDERQFVWRQIAGPLAAATALTNEFDYDEHGKLSAARVAAAASYNENASTLYSYDGFNRCVSVTDAMGNVISFAYDRNGNPVFSRASCETNDLPGSAGNVRYQEWRWTFDAQDRCTESRASFFDPITQSPIGDGFSVTTYAYAPNGQCKSITDDNNHVTRLSYDTVGRLASVMDAKSNSVAFAYDPNGNVIAVTGTDRSDVAATVQEFSNTYTYDNLNRRVTTHDNVGNTRLCAYDSLDRVVRSVDPNTNTTFYGYDDLGRRTLAIADLNRDGIADLAVDVYRAWVYDDNSRCLSETDDNTNVTVYAYDSRNRLAGITFADNTSCSLVWSPRSNLRLRQDPNGTVISNSFDLLCRCVSRQITPGGGVAASTTFELFAYDGLSRMVMASNNLSHVEFAYDSMGNRVRAAALGLAPAPLLRSFDGAGNCLTMTYPSGRQVTYTYDALDRPATSSTPLVDGAPPVLLASFAYEGRDRLVRIARMNGINTRIDWDGAVSPPNATGDFGWRQVSRINHQAAGGGPVVDRRSMTYDPAQNKTMRAQLVPFGANGDMTTNRFEYDALDRLNHAINTKGSSSTLRTYNLDGNGNRLTVLDNGAVEPYVMDATTPSPADFQMDQYTLTPFGIQTYDSNGNLLSFSSAMQQLQYQYDYADRLVAVNDLSTGMLAPVAHYDYDALGHRIRKTVFPQPPLSPVITEYIVDADCDGDPAPPLEIRPYGVAGEVFILDGTRSQDDEFVRITAAGQPQFYLCDDLGNVLALTDVNGSVIDRCDYDEFGVPTFLTSDGLPIQTNAAPSGNPFLFCGMEWDSETALYFGHSQGATTGPYNARDGRYLIRSGVPIRFDGNNRSFAGNNPWSAKSSPPRGFGAGQPHPQARERLKTYFETGDIPTENQFADLIDSRAIEPSMSGLQPRGGDILIHGKLTRPILKSFFQTGDKPTQAQFGALIDSMVHYQDDRSMTERFVHRMEFGQTLPEKRKE